ncbi:hypothetical protein AB835_11100 [Candidatus Endobugula sertula]|uniref:HTH cro/C1-type domain-containing protein n=1 Tax=Candidatus Endobugula sertula TaxID=62101 RepID=A0A1D2QN76_9GAMM|nr:hypothetical protein AB835_11100 [Candidatus Endobugula sertula]
MQTLLQPEQSIEARELLNLSQAKETGVNRAYLSQFENGKRILKDAENDALINYYDEQGLDVDALRQKANQEEQKIPINPDLTPVYSINPYRIRDGIVISSHLANDTVEALMNEYHNLDSQIEQALEQPIVRGLFGLSRADTTEKAIQTLLDCYRQRHIKLVLQGRESEQPEKTVDDSDIKTVDEFINTNNMNAS